MGNISASILFPSPKTACYKVLGWCSQKLRWKDFEFPDHIRRVVKTTVTIDMEKAPATALRRRLRQRLNRHPSTMAVLWTNSHHMTTAVTLSIENV
jgi:hypothetical protein